MAKLGRTTTKQNKTTSNQHTKQNNYKQTVILGSILECRLFIFVKFVVHVEMIRQDNVEGSRLPLNCYEYVCPDTSARTQALVFLSCSITPNSHRLSHSFVLTQHQLILSSSQL